MEGRDRRDLGWRGEDGRGNLFILPVVHRKDPYLLLCIFKKKIPSHTRLAAKVLSHGPGSSPPPSFCPPARGALPPRPVLTCRRSPAPGLPGLSSSSSGRSLLASQARGPRVHPQSTGCSLPRGSVGTSLALTLAGAAPCSGPWCELVRGGD